jgi:DNA-binding transcriptional ArsR family regulator/NAD-dependent dihydropyrimidine dehydrogenase PreA subunit
MVFLVRKSIGGPPFNHAIVGVAACASWPAPKRPWPLITSCAFRLSMIRKAVWLAAQFAAQSAPMMGCSSRLLRCCTGWSRNTGSSSKPGRPCGLIGSDSAACSPWRLQAEWLPVRHRKMDVFKERYKSVARLMAAFAHPVRLKILNHLAIEPAFVCDLVDKLGYRQANISQQLAILRGANLVDFVRDGPRVKYFLLEASVMRIIELARNSSSSSKSKPKDFVQKSPIRNSIWQSISSDQINWRPEIAFNHCNGCGICVISCLQGVYGFDYEVNQPVVTTSASCTTGCTTCASVCVRDAIRFPLNQIQRLVKQERLQLQAKTILNAARQEYDIKSFKTTAR